MDFLKIRLLRNGLIYILEAKEGVTWECWLEPEWAVEFVKVRVKSDRNYQRQR